MSSLLYVENYEECYILSSQQLLSLETIVVTSDSLVNNCKKYRVVSLLGQKDYSKILKIYDINKESDMILTELTCIKKIKLNLRIYLKY